MRIESGAKQTELTRVVFESREDRVRIELAHQADADCVRRWTHTVTGTSGPLYRNLRVGHTIANLKNPYLFKIFSGENFAGTVAYSGRKVKIGETEVQAFYGSHLSIDPQFSRRGLGRILSQQAVNYFRKHVSTPHLVYSIVEHGNSRSIRIGEARGAKACGTVGPVFFSRLFPRRLGDVSPYDSSQKAEILERIKRVHERHVLTQFDAVFLEDRYFVLRRNGRIVAGTQVHLHEWEVLSLGGKFGKVSARILPHLPGLKRVMNPNRHRFIVFEGYFHEEGCFNALLELFETMLHEHEVYSSIFYLDRRDPSYPTFKNSGKLGLMNRLLGEMPGSVLVHNHGLPSETITRLEQGPLYVSGFDCG